MPTTTDELVELARQTLDDVIEPYLVSDARIIQALDLAQRDFAERTLCLTVAGAPLTLIAEEPFTYLADDVLRVRAFTVDGRSVPPTTFRAVCMGGSPTDYGPRVTDATLTEMGRPRAGITDLQSDAVRWAPTPDQAYEATMDYYAYPPRMADGEEPTIPPRWRGELVAGAAARLYKSRDVEVFDPRAAQMYQQQWYTTLAEAYASTQRGQRGAQTAQFNRNGVW